jgi:hypothetical protein
MAALGREEGWRRGRRRISGKRLRSIEMLKSQGMSNRAIAHRLGVSEKAIRKLVGPLKPAESAQLAFAGMTTAAAGQLTPAMAAGMTDKLRSIGDIVKVSEDWEDSQTNAKPKGSSC